MKILEFILDIIAPKKCYSCGQEGAFICQECLHKEKDFENICYVCKKKTSNGEVCKNCRNYVSYDKIIILKHYSSGVISKLIKDGKFHNKKGIFIDFAKSLSNKIKENHLIIKQEKYIIIPTPSHFLKKLKRGYNQTELIAKEVSKSLNIEYNSSVIKKTKWTRQQSLLSREERQLNQSGVFFVNKNLCSLIKGKNIILVDDVITTGTTLNEVSKVLKSIGAKSIIGLIIASD